MTNKKPRVVIFFGGEGKSTDLSEESGYWACQYMPRSKYEVTPVKVNQNGNWQVPLGSLPQRGPIERMMSKIFEAVPSLPATKALERLLRKPVNAMLTFVRGVGGDDGSLHGLGRALSIPVIGSSLPVCQQTSDKYVSAKRLKDIIATPETKYFKNNADPQKIVDQIREIYPPPLFVKPVHEEASIGVEEVQSIDELAAAVRRTQESGDVLIQEKSRGQEMNITLFNDNHNTIHSLPPTNIIPKRASFYDYLAKRKTDRVILDTPSSPEHQTFNQLQTVARDIYNDLGCEGIVSFDLHVDGKKTQLLEINTVPTFTNMTPLLQQLKASHINPGIFFSQQIDRHLQ